MFRENVVFRFYGDAAYLLNPHTGRSYFFEDTAALILSAVAEGETDPPGIAERIAEEYEIPSPEETEADIRTFLDMLRVEGILDGRPAAGPVPEDALDAWCRKNGALESVMLELTYRCNEQCVHCYTCDTIRDPRRELTLTDYRKILKDLADYGVHEVVLTGGEIGLRKDFPDIYRYAVSQGLIVSLMTNGTLLTDAHLDMLAECPPKIVYISFYGASPETHDAVTRIPGSFQASLRTLMSLKCAGVSVGMKTVAMKPILPDYDRLVLLAKRLNVGLGTGIYLTCGNNGSREPAQYRLTEDAEYERIVGLKQAYARSSTPSRLRDRKGPICEAGLMTCTINPYGDYYVCSSLPVPCGNILETPIAEFWEHNAFLNRIRAVRFTDTACEACEYADSCVYCIGANYVETGSLFAVQKEHCQAAKAFHRYFQAHEMQPVGEGLPPC